MKLQNKYNPLVENFHSSRSQEENYTTEAFASLLKYLVKNEKEVAASFLNFLTNRKFDLKKYNDNEVKIRTQVFTRIFDDKGRPDIEIDTPDHLIYFENKIEASLGHKQIERYKTVLRHSGKANTLLILVSKYRLEFQTEPDFYLRWFQIAQRLEEILDRLESNESRVIVSQFLDFLRYRYLAPEPVRIRVSPSLKKYIQREGKNNLILRYMKRSRDLGDDSDLIPLRKLLNVMAFSIERAYPNVGFGFSNSIEGLKGEFSGIGFNIGYVYDFFLDINQPNILFLKLPSRHIIKPAKFIGDFGKLVEISGTMHWIAALKLSAKDISFFTKSFDEQIILLSDFLKKCRNAIKRLLV